jgi:hypothetical protein
VNGQLTFAMGRRRSADHGEGSHSRVASKKYRHMAVLTLHGRDAGSSGISGGVIKAPI